MRQRKSSAQESGRAVAWGRRVAVPAAVGGLGISLAISACTSGDGRAQEAAANGPQGQVSSPDSWAAAGGREAGAAAARPLAAAASQGRSTQALTRPTDDPALQVGWAEGLLTLHVQDRPLHTVLQAIEHQVGIPIVAMDGIGALSVSGEVDRAVPAEALVTLLHQFDVLLLHAASPSAPSRLKAAWVYAQGRGPGVAAPPRTGPDSAWRPGPPEAADAGLAGHDGAGADAAHAAEDLRRDVLSPDAWVRRRALARSLALRVALPQPSLQQLAGFDQDPRIRLLALQLLSQEPAAAAPALRMAVQRALQDADDGVRSQARDLMEQLDLAALPSDALPIPGP